MGTAVLLGLTTQPHRGPGWQDAPVPGAWTLLWIVNAVLFAVYLHRSHYRRLWLGVLAALLFGPLVWPWWGYLSWRDTATGRRVLRRTP